MLPNLNQMVTNNAYIIRPKANTGKVANMYNLCFISGFIFWIKNDSTMTLKINQKPVPKRTSTNNSAKITNGANTEPNFNLNIPPIAKSMQAQKKEPTKIQT